MTYLVVEATELTRREAPEPGSWKLIQLAEAKKRRGSGGVSMVPYAVTVKTGHHMGAGTDAKVSIQLLGTQGPQDEAHVAPHPCEGSHVMERAQEQKTRSTARGGPSQVAGTPHQSPLRWRQMLQAREHGRYNARDRQRGGNDISCQ